MPVPLAPKAYELLLALVKRHGHLASREELMQEIWPDSFVEEINLTVNISLLRKALGEQPDGRQYIATVPKRGYRFDAAVCESQQEVENAAVTGAPPAEEAKDLASPPQSPNGNGIVDAVSESRKPKASLYAAGLVFAAVVILAGLLLWRNYRSDSNSGLAQGGQSQSNRSGTQNAQAFALYTRARDLWSRRSVESVQQSLELFHEAIDADPKFA